MGKTYKHNARRTGGRTRARFGIETRIAFTEGKPAVVAALKAHVRRCERQRLKRMLSEEFSEMLREQWEEDQDDLLEHELLLKDYNDRDRC